MIDHRIVLRTGYSCKFTPGQCQEIANQLDELEALKKRIESSFVLAIDDEGNQPYLSGLNPGKYAVVSLKGLRWPKSDARNGGAE